MTPTTVVREEGLGVVAPIRHSISALTPIVGPDRYDALLRDAETFRRQYAGVTVWNVNSTATGGGVAEMLQTLVGYVRDLGVDMRWVVIDGEPDFFDVTKRLHNALHGHATGRALTDADSAVYQRVSAANARALVNRVRAGDVVILHDPQTAGLAPLLTRPGVRVVWRCHIGSDRHTEVTRSGWRFLSRYLSGVDGYVFSRAAFVPDWIPLSRTWIIPPSIDPFAPKNASLEPATVQAVLTTAGLLDGPTPGEAPRFTSLDGSLGTVACRAAVVADRLPGQAEPVLLQVSRWDRLKDMAGVLDAFVRYVAPRTDGTLALVGPAVDDVTDDPEGAQVYAECIERWRQTPQPIRSRIMIAALPMDDIDENAVVVNALQRHATVVSQKSLAEGFGLTVAEAMWKGRAVIGSAVGGIPEQITAGTGLLLPDPTDLAEFGAQVRRLLADGALRNGLGAAARQRIRDHFLGDLHLRRYAAMLATLSAE